MKSILAILEESINIEIKNFLVVVINGSYLGFSHVQYKDIINQLSPHITIKDQVIHIQTPEKDAASVTAFFKKINQELVTQNILQVTHDYEMCPVAHSNLNQPLFSIFRYAVPFWGMKLYGVHLNGLTRVNGNLSMWVSRRALNKLHNPGKLDNLVSGALVSGLNIRQNLYKEAEEEANISPAMLEKAIPVGMVRSHFQRDDYFYRCVPFIYDLWMPNDFTPVSLDRSASEFFIMPLQDFIENPHKLKEFKTACQFVIVNLLMRYGLLDPDEPCYETLVATLQA